MPAARLTRLKLEGADPHRWGLQHGETLRENIRAINQIRLRLLDGYFAPAHKARIPLILSRHVETLRTRYADLYAELQGISRASGVAETDLICLNAYTDLRDFSADPVAPDETGCSAVAVYQPGAVAFAGQTWDMHASAMPFITLIEVPGRDGATRVLSVAGCLGLAGVNAQGVSVMINNLSCRETNLDGLVWPGLVRSMLRAPDARGAAATLQHHLPSSGHNYLIADPTRVINVETTGLRTCTTDDFTLVTGGAVWHTNHYRSYLRETEIRDRLGPTTHRRGEAVQAYLQTAGPRVVSSLRHDFFEAGEPCATICLPTHPTDPHAPTTCGGIGVDHFTHKAFVFAGKYAENQRFEWTLS